MGNASIGHIDNNNNNNTKSMNSINARHCAWRGSPYFTYFSGISLNCSTVLSSCSHRSSLASAAIILKKHFRNRLVIRLSIIALLTEPAIIWFRNRQRGSVSRGCKLPSWMITRSFRFNNLDISKSKLTSFYPESTVKTPRVHTTITHTHKACHRRECVATDRDA